LKLHLDNRAGVNTFTGYGAGYVSVNGARHEKNLVVLATEIICDWAPGGFDSLSPDHLAPLARHGLEIVLIGTGTRLRFPRPEILRPLIEARIGVEVMDVQAACRTYNILAAESRKVAAALLLAD
jgi:uncharacterized protein